MTPQEADQLADFYADTTGAIPIPLLYPWWCNTCNTWRHLQEVQGEKQQCVICNGPVVWSSEATEYIQFWEG